MGAMKKFRVTFLPSGRTADVEPGATVMDAAALCGLWIDAPCGGAGRCGKCRVETTGPAGEVTPPEEELLDPAQLERGVRLACQSVVEGDITARPLSVPSWAGSKAGLAGARSLELDLAADPRSSDLDRPLGIAVDVGTTTITVSALDLTDGTRLGVVSSENPQTSFGADVLTRIDRCMREDGASSAMHRIVVEAVNRLTKEALSDSTGGTGDVARIVLVGNTTMITLALGFDPSPLGRVPFEPPLWGPVEAAASERGFHASVGARLLVPRVISGFLGADILAAVLALEIAEHPETRMVVDLGTNGEIALGNTEAVLACSTAAGPAFEGAGISRGMRAAPGAIESVSRDGRFALRVLGGGRPLGLCGSGLMDAVAALLDSGLLAGSGRLVSPRRAQDKTPGRMRDAGDGRRFALSPDEGIDLTQEDVRQLQLAKGAIRAGADILCERLAKGFSTVKTVYLAGAFGNFLKPESALDIGLFPRILGDRIEFAGNAALAGAEMMLASDESWRRANELSERVEVVELSGDDSFQKRFIEDLAFRDA
jgi:uncharacterized 2Fe-2S/4Fe-4S cluster protein (DUF4445 family)